MSGREYRDKLTLSGLATSSISTIGSDPNGVVSGDKGSLLLRNDVGNVALYQNTDGATAWSIVGGGGGSYPVVVLDTAASPSGNVYSTSATALAALAALPAGQKWLLIRDLATTWSTAAGSGGTFNMEGVTIQFEQRTATLTIGDGMIWSKVPLAILGFSSVNFTNTTTPVYNGDGSNFQMTLDGTRFQTSGVSGGIAPFVLNGTTFIAQFNLRGITNFRGFNNGFGNIHLIKLFNTNTQVIVNMYDASEILNGGGEWWPFEDTGGGKANSPFVTRFGAATQFSAPDPTIEQINVGRPGVMTMTNDPDLALIQGGPSVGGTVLTVPYSPNTFSALSPSPTNTAAQWVSPLWVNNGCGQIGKVYPAGRAANTLASDGIVVPAGVTTSVGIINIDTGGLDFLQTTSALAGDERGWALNEALVSRNSLGRIYIRFRIGSVTGVRWFIGLSDVLGASHATNSASDSPAANMVGLQFSTSRGDTQVQFMAQTAAGQQKLYNSNITAFAGTGKLGLEIDLNKRFLSYYQTNSAISSVQFTTAIGDHFPGTAVPLGLVMSITSIDGSQKNFSTMSALIGNDP